MNYDTVQKNLDLYHFAVPFTMQFFSMKIGAINNLIIELFRSKIQCIKKIANLLNLLMTAGRFTNQIHKRQGRIISISFTDKEVTLMQMRVNPVTDYY